MATSNLIRKRLGYAAAPAAGATSTIYTVPAGRSAIIKEYVVAGSTAGAVRVLLNGVPVVYDVAVAAGEQMHLPLSGLKLAAGDAISVYSTVGGMHHGLMGYEWDGTGIFDPLSNIGRQSVNSTTTLQTMYTVPAGKLYVIRECLFVNTSGQDVLNARVYISNPGSTHAAWIKSPKQSVTAVKCDHVVPAGSTVNYIADIANYVRVWITGIVEDA